MYNDIKKSKKIMKTSLVNINGKKECNFPTCFFPTQIVVVGQVIVLQYVKILSNSRKLIGALVIPELHGSLLLVLLYEQTVFRMKEP